MSLYFMMTEMLASEVETETRMENGGGNTSKGAAVKSSSGVANSEASCMILLTAVDLKLTFGLDEEADMVGCDDFKTIMPRGVTGSVEVEEDDELTRSSSASLFHSPFSKRWRYILRK